MITDQQWEIFRLREQEGLSLDTISKKMGLKTDLACNLLNDMRKQEPDLFFSEPPRAYSYNPSMDDGQVVKKW